MRSLIFTLFVCVLAFFFPKPLRAQHPDTAVFRLDSLPLQGVLLDKGWKFHAGDDRTWADPTYHDQLWASIDPTRDIHDLPSLSNSGIVWFRLHLSVDSTLLRESLALVIQQSGASEIYLNGRLLYRFGTLSAYPEEIRAYDPLWKPLSFTIRKAGEQVLAVRYALQPGIRYTAMFESQNPALWIQVKTMETAVDFQQEQISLTLRFQMLIIGVSSLLAILHLAFYLFYPTRKINLYFGLYAFLYMSGILVQNLFFLEAHRVADKFYLANTSFALMLVGEVLMLTALYHLLEQKKDRVYWFLLGWITIGLFLNAGTYGWGWKVGGALSMFFLQLNVARISFLAIRRKKKGAWIIAVGAICYVVFFSAFLSMGIFQPGSFFLNQFPIRMTAYLIGVLSIPVATSIYLGLDFAFISRALQQKLIEVEVLSRQALAQEQEKQLILTSQNETLERQVGERTVELTHQKEELQSTLEHLKATQAQLIQSEKMASLGELTAGIAHEIQNPLNFVNNFSEVSEELVQELKEELREAVTENDKREAVNDLLADLTQNLAKIHHHGQRADGIVKGMLQHSRASTGEKCPTDLNALADEYLRLSYHGLRAKDKDFNAKLITRFDAQLGKVAVVPQDLGRVLLNLFNNAFYAVMEKKKQADPTYQPEVSVITQRRGNQVEVYVRDNGVGIPAAALGKIFQPFFTTKPTGQGTGLGLSLSYDIITKGHGGELKVETVVGEFAEFVITLPIT